MKPKRQGIGIETTGVFWSILRLAATRGLAEAASRSWLELSLFEQIRCSANFSYRSPVAIVPIGLSGVCPGVKPRHASISSLGLDPTSKSLESGPGVQNLIECYNWFAIGHRICRWAPWGLKLELKIRS